jgi:16S rRNA (guanine527-N7)-methyltransferase
MTGPQGIVDRLHSGAEAVLGRSLLREESEAFHKYLALLLKWQRVQRLVGSSSPEWIVDKLFLDSLLFLRVLPLSARVVADVGSGAGLPGIPLRIVRPDMAMTLIESRERRASFLATVIRELPLSNTSVARTRVEDIDCDLVRTFDAVVMRCAGTPEDLWGPAARLVRPGGVVILSGPPEQRPLPRGEWVEVRGIRPESIRRFAIFRP